MRYFLISFAVLNVFGSAAYASCPDVQDFLHAASSGWALEKPEQLNKPLTGTQLCTSSSVSQYGAMCIRRAASAQEAQDTASVWLHEIKNCLQAKPRANGIRTVQASQVQHEVMEFEPVFYRDLPFRMSLRITQDPKNPSVAWVVAPVLDGQNTSKKQEDNMCPMIQGFLSYEHRSQDWKNWQGPIIEQGEGYSQHICAKLPTGAASRYDCDLKVGASSNIWQTRWVYALNKTDSIEEIASSMAKNVSSCDVGLEWKKGRTRHIIDNPTSKTRIQIISNKNDVGRGPSVVLSVEHWKN